MGSGRGILFVHAHPDDESCATGGAIAHHVALGDRVTVVTCTRGEQGRIAVPALAHLAADRDDRLGEHRAGELRRALAHLGVEDHRYLVAEGRYRDSGRFGLPSNDRSDAFWQADLDEAGGWLAAVIDEVRPEIVVTYDPNGGYGHPDHIQVHRVGTRAAQLADTPVVVQSTMNRDHIGRAWAAAEEMGLEFTDQDVPRELPEGFGTPESEITHLVRATDVVGRKRASMLAHGSQIGADHFMAAMPLEAFEFVFGTEYFIVADMPSDPPAVFAELFEALPPHR